MGSFVVTPARRLTVMLAALVAAGATVAWQGALGGLAAPALLYNQMGTPAGYNGWCSSGSATVGWRYADDFTVPAGSTWHVAEVDAHGGNNGTVTSFNVVFFADATGTPGAVVAQFLNVTVAPTNPTIPVDVNLAAGKFWVSVQAVSANSCDWGWNMHTTVGYQGSQQHNGGAWVHRSDDVQFSLLGTSRAITALTTAASAGTAAGGNISDTASLTGGAAPSGTITFKLFGPDDTQCALPAAGSTVVNVSGNGAYPSGPIAVSKAGTYRFTAAYSGDANNVPSASLCNAANESVAVTKAAPTVKSTATPAVKAGESVSDTGTLSGGVNPTGTMTFRVYGAADTTCALAPVATSTKTVTGNGTYTSDPYMAPSPGTYRWTAAYSGDANNLAATSACGDVLAASVVSAAVVPTLPRAGSPAGPAQGLPVWPLLAGWVLGAVGLVRLARPRGSRSTGGVLPTMREP